LNGKREDKRKGKYDLAASARKIGFDFIPVNKQYTDQQQQDQIFYKRSHGLQGYAISKTSAFPDFTGNNRIAG